MMPQAGYGAGLRLIQRPREIEASLWRRLRFEGDLHCREALIEHHLPLARALAGREFRRWPPHGFERTDFEHLAISGLLEAIDRYDPLAGASFRAFAKHRIRGAIADGLAHASENASQYNYRRRVERERIGSLRAEAAGDPIAQLSDLAAGLAIGLMAEAAAQSASPLNPYETSAWRELEQSVRTEIDLLPEMEKSVIKQHYTNGVAFTDIARLMGLSKGRVSQIHRAAIARLRARLSRIE